MDDELQKEDYVTPPIKYEYLDHTADVQLHAWGDTLEEAFEQCAVAMFGYMTDLERVEITQVHHVEAEGHDLQSLLFHFLDELLFMFCAEPFLVAKKVKITEFDRENFRIKATGMGEEFSIGKHSQEAEIATPRGNAFLVTHEVDAQLALGPCTLAGAAYGPAFHHPSISKEATIARLVSGKKRQASGSSQSWKRRKARRLKGPTGDVHSVDIVSRQSARTLPPSPSRLWRFRALTVYANDSPECRATAGECKGKQKHDGAAERGRDIGIFHGRTAGACVADHGGGHFWRVEAHRGQDDPWILGLFAAVLGAVAKTPHRRCSSVVPATRSNDESPRGPESTYPRIEDTGFGGSSRCFVSPSTGLGTFRISGTAGGG
ncbi:hypothetical protein KM043_017713 [Ampulex compressa]|nr:hypothetical protein KM043_017713 [Ampulex compressa]